MPDRIQEGATDYNPLIPRDVSPWTTAEKVTRMMWAIVQATLFRLSFHNWYGWRAKILRLFGAKIGNNLRIRRTATIEIPSNLVIGDDVIIGDGAILYALGTITLGDRVMISQYVHLCAGSHDHRYSTYPQTRPPVTIEKDCWVAAAAFIGPGVTVRQRTVVGARACVFKDTPAGVIMGGNPAKVIKTRVLDGEAPMAAVAPVAPEIAVADQPSVTVP